MAFQFEHPKFNWDAPEPYQEFKRFREHCEFVFAGPLSDANEKQKCGWVGSWIGEHGREVYKTLEFTEEERTNLTYDTLMTKFELFVRPKRNKRVARHRLKQRKQRPEESFMNFVKDLKIIIMDCDCEYQDSDDLLVDNIIDGVKDTKLQEKLLDRGEELTLQKALEIGQQFEHSQTQIKMRRDEQSSAVAQVKTKFEKKKQTKFRSRPKQCSRCGKDSAHAHCPAKATKCTYCGKQGHWKLMCRFRQKSVHRIEESDTELELLEVQSLNTELKSNKKDRWIETLQIGKKKIPFRVDTGAKCNIIQWDHYKHLQEEHRLYSSKKVLKTFSNHIIKPVGATEMTVKWKNTTKHAQFQIVKVEGAENILSGDDAEALGIISKVDTLKEKNKTALEDFPELLETTGVLPGEYEIKLEEHAKGVVHPCRKFPPALNMKIKETLKEMEKEGHIEPVNEPTEWVSSMVVAVKKDKVRICLDPRDLNQVIKREHHPMRTVDDVIKEIGGATVFSKLDAKSGFLQIKLDNQSSKLTTFNTPLGRYKWLRLPFGLKCSPEIFQRIMDDMLQGINGAFAVIDDILVAGRDMKEHDKILKQVLKRASEYNLKLNLDKLEVRQSSVKYCGHIISAQGLKPDPEKIEAVMEMPRPENKESLRRFLGFVNYLGKFIPNLSKVDEPLRALLKKTVLFEWQPQQEQAFQELKQLCTQAPVLTYFDVTKQVEIQCDASSTGIGAVLLQENKPVAYSSRALTETETRYAQIEKEMLAIVHSLKKFHSYVFGGKILVYTDHKPLEQIFKKPLAAAPMRLQRMLLAIQWYDLEIQYRKGKDMQLPDTLSRAYITSSQGKTEVEDLNTVKMADYLNITEERYRQFQDRTKEELSELYQTIKDGWPEQKNKLDVKVTPYFESRSELTVSDGIIYKGLRLVVPKSLRGDMLKLIHMNHLGIMKCKQRAREVFYWPSMNNDIEETIRNCEKCAEFQNKQTSEPLKPTPLPEFPFAEISVDIFEFQSHQYLITVDYYSRFIQTEKLSNLRSGTVIETLKHQFSVHGIPVKIKSDCGTQFTSQDFQHFCKDYGIGHELTSPHHQSANGMAERGVQIVKKLWSKSKDKHLAILDYNSTPREGINLSPAQLLMGRRPRNLLPTSKKLLQPKTLTRNKFAQQYYKEKDMQKYYHDRRTRSLRSLPVNQPVRLAPTQGNKTWEPGRIVKHYHPRSYEVESNGTTYRRNRKHLRVSSEECNARSSRYQAEQDPFETESNHEEEHESAASTSMTEHRQSTPTRQYYPAVTQDNQSQTAGKPNEGVESNSPKPCSHSAGKLRDNLSLSQTPHTTNTKTRSGRIVRKPHRYMD